jgi:hypothetical protein
VEQMGMSHGYYQEAARWGVVKLYYAHL